MNTYVRFVCKKIHTQYYLNILNKFLCDHYVNTEDVTVKAYWKNEECIECETSCNIPLIDIALIVDFVNEQFGKGEEIYCVEDNEFIEISIYSSMDKIILQDKCFLQIYINKTAYGR